MPVIGTFDQERGEQLQVSLLKAITEYRAHTVILDTTGVGMIDDAGAQLLIQIIQSAGLLGAEVILVGVTPEVAEVLVNLHFPLGQLPTMADLQAAVSYALSSQGQDGLH